MREIKFRVWITDWGNSTSHLEYIKEGCLHVYFGNWERGGYKNAIFQQFTGLKDKNGKEIYDGDIVFFDDHEIASKPYIGRAEVFWCEDLTLCNSPQWALWAIGEKSGYYGYLIGEIEVIGNIFENPDLLK